MEIKVIGSGSTGNAYSIKTSEVHFLVECGMSKKHLLKGMDYNIPDFCFISHEHGDHAKSVGVITEMAVDVICSKGTSEALGLEKWEWSDKLDNDEIKISMFDVEHDARQPTMLVVDDKVSKERLLFVTDSKSIPVMVDGISHLLIEANYSDFTFDENCAYDQRVRETHMSLETAIEYVELMDKSRLVEIHLIHLSNSNSDAKYFLEKMKKVSGVPVHIA